MIWNITTHAQCEEFVSGFFTDESFSDPMLLTDEQLQHNLIKSINQTDRHDVIGFYRDEELIGLFAFLVLKDENYLEMLMGLSREENAYREMFSYLTHHYAGYQADFVFNPNNTLLKKLLIEKNAEFDTEQQKMLFTSPIPTIDTTGVQLLSEKYHAQYCAMHTQDMYWVGEKVIAAPERFRTLVAIHEDQVVGYLDVTHCFAENEPFDLVVLPEYRRMGYGKKLLAKALELNRPNDMMLLVDIDNEAALHLYSSMGFTKIRGQNCQTVHLTL